MTIFLGILWLVGLGLIIRRIKLHHHGLIHNYQYDAILCKLTLLAGILLVVL